MRVCERTPVNSVTCALARHTSTASSSQHHYKLLTVLLGAGHVAGRHARRTVMYTLLTRHAHSVTACSFMSKLQLTEA
jgi:hypothetical protein